MLWLDTLLHALRLLLASFMMYSFPWPINRSDAMPSLDAITGATTRVALSVARIPDSRVTLMSLEELRFFIESGLGVVVDVRSFASYQAGHIPTAWSIPVDHLNKTAPRWLISTKPVVVYCGGPPCPKSRLGAKQLVALGYVDVRRIPAGYEGWLEKGYPYVLGRRPGRWPYSELELEPHQGSVETVPTEK